MMINAALQTKDDQTLKRTKPFLKWAGGKSSLLSTLRQSTPLNFKSYFEPFVGGGAMFFDLRPKKAVLSDSNAELILCYKVVRDAPQELIKKLSCYRVNEKEYYRIRSLKPETLEPIDRAARMIYLNKTCFNGLYRVNRKGEFNTPFGNYKQISLVDENNLIAASNILQSATLKCDSYDRVVLEHAKKGDFVYLDPPYIPVSVSSDFKRYTATQFYEDDHSKLASVFCELDQRGCFLLLSNSFHPKAQALYHDFHIKTVSAPRFISCKGGDRGHVKELLVTNF